MSIYILEKYGKKDIPEYGVAFQTPELLDEYVYKQLGLNIRLKSYMKNELQIGWSLGLDDSGSYRVSKIPLIKDANDKTHNNLFKGYEEPTVEDATELLVPSEPQPINFYTKNIIENDDIVIDIGKFLTQVPPVLVKRHSFNLSKGIDPYTREKVKGPIKTRKVKLKG